MKDDLPIDLEKVPVRDRDVACRIMDGELVAVVPRRSTIHTLNAIGTKVWELTDGRRSIRQIALAITEEYDVDFSRASVDTVSFIQELRLRGLVVLRAEEEKRGG